MLDSFDVDTVLSPGTTSFEKVNLINCGCLMKSLKLKCLTFESFPLHSITGAILSQHHQKPLQYTKVHPKQLTNRHSTHLLQEYPP